MRVSLPPDLPGVTGLPGHKEGSSLDGRSGESAAEEDLWNTHSVSSSIEPIRRYFSEVAGQSKSFKMISRQLNRTDRGRNVSRNGRYIL